MKKAIGLLLLVATIALTGCQTSSNDDNVSYFAITRNLTPELMTLSERPIDVDRNMAVQRNQNYRMFWGDLGRVIYTNRASGLSPYPIQRTSGIP